MRLEEERGEGKQMIKLKNRRRKREREKVKGVEKGSGREYGDVSTPVRMLRL